MNHRPIWTAEPDPDPHWRSRAACTIADVPLFATAGNSGFEYRHARSEALAKCMGCPVLIPCRDDVMRTEGSEEYGGREEFRAGMTPRERGLLYRRNRKAAAAAAAKQAAEAAALDATEQATNRPSAELNLHRYYGQP
jgi:hypothetical protein